MRMIEAEDKRQWDDFVTSHPEANFLQSWDWGDFHLARGKRIVRRIALEGEKVLGAYVGQVETIYASRQKKTTVFLRESDLS